MKFVYKFCNGPNKEPRKEKCPIKGMFLVENKGDAADYNGVKNWRCPHCFKEHIKKSAVQ